MLAAWVDGQRFRFQRPIRLKELRSIHEGRNADLDVLWVRKGQKVKLRLVLIWNPERSSHMVIVTNLDRDLAPLVHTIRDIYRLRWQIELQFKEWKSFSNLHSFLTKIPVIAEGLIWASLTAVAIKRFLVHAAERVHQDNERSTQRAAKALANKLETLLVVLLTRSPIGEALRDTLESLNDNVHGLGRTPTMLLATAPW